MNLSNLILEIKENIAQITINRPEALNAISEELMSELEHLFTVELVGKDIFGAILTGAGEKAFVAGADIKSFPNLDQKQAIEKSAKGHRTFNAIENFHVPVIAAVNGFALGGGCELAMACHMRVASENAKFGQPEVNLGLVPGYGGTQRLPMLIGKTKAIELLLTGDMIDAQEAYRLGLVNYVVPAGEEVAKSSEIINKISKKGPTAVKECIQLVNSFYKTETNGFDEEIERFGACMLTDEAKEGVAAFLERRKPSFRK